MRTDWDARRRRGRDPVDAETPEVGANRQTASLAGLAAALAIVVLSLMVVRALHEKVALEDCLLSGRQDCDVLIPGSHS